MKLSPNLMGLVLAQALLGSALPQGLSIEKRAEARGPEFTEGQPVDGKGKGARILGMLGYDSATLFLGSRHENESLFGVSNFILMQDCYTTMLIPTLSQGEQITKLTCKTRITLASNQQTPAWFPI